jgi:hypothetical protein
MITSMYPFELEMNQKRSLVSGYDFMVTMYTIAGVEIAGCHSTQ